MKWDRLKSESRPECIYTLRRVKRLVEFTVRAIIDTAVSSSKQTNADVVVNRAVTAVYRTFRDDTKKVATFVLYVILEFSLFIIINVVVLRYGEKKSAEICYFYYYYLIFFFK